MTRFFRILPLLIVSLSLISCETEIDVNDDWEDVTVIYGLLDPRTSTNWVRIERGWLGNAPASASFDEPDSLYYDSLRVLLRGVDANGDTTYSTSLVKDESPEREPGEFTTEGFRLYRIDGKLPQNLTYHLTVQKPGTDFPDAEASTILVEAPTPVMSNPPPNPFQFQPPLREFINRISRFNGRIEWYASDNAEIYEIDVYFHYREMDRNTKQVEEKSFKLDWETLVGPFPDKTDFRSNIGLQGFYQRVAGQIPPNPDKLRFFDKMRVDLWAGGEHLRRYIQLNEPSSGLSQTKPEFEQVENGTGLLSSRTRLTVDDVELSTDLTTGIRPFYQDPILCDRNFAVVEAQDTCHCEFLGAETIKVCE